MTFLIVLPSRMTGVLAACLAFLALALAGCEGEKAARSDEAPKSVSTFFPVRLGDRTVRLQFALLPLEQQRGLMERRDLGADDGMVFVYKRPQAANFWMRNTPTPLDIGFFDAAGVLLEVYPMHPYDETGVKSRSNEVKFAVEMPQGWYSRNQVRPGAAIDLKAVAAAIRARGMQPSQFRIDP